MYHQTNRTNRESGVSEIIGAVLLVSVVVIAVAGIGVLLLSGGTPQKLPALQAVISNVGNEIYIYHDGGDALQSNQVSILVNGVPRTFIKAGNLWTTWSIGETLSFDATNLGTINDVRIIYGNSGSSLVLASAQFGPAGMPTEVPVIYVPVASFNGTPTTGAVGFAVQFTDTSINNPTSWSWDFGDGTNSTAQNPSHQYSVAGTYSVALTATNVIGSSTATKSNYITVTPPPPVADFSGLPVSGSLPLSVVFTDRSTNAPTSWLWNFSDGTTSTVQNPTHSYTAIGSYNVSLTATNAYGFNSTTKINYITVNPLVPVASFTATPVWGIIPLPVQFSDTSINIPTSWNWSFGDGTFSTLQNPSHTYTVMGYYNVSLTAVNSAGNNTVTYQKYITAGMYTSGWRARYYSVEQNYDPQNLRFTNNPSQIHFANDIALTNYSYLSSDVPNWPFPYLGYTEYYSDQFDSFLNIATPGSYTFYMWSDDGATLTIDNTTVINDNNLHSPHYVSNSITLSAGHHPINIQHWNHAEASVISLGYSSSDLTGPFVTNVERITAVYPPTASFTATPTSGTAPLTVQFTDTSTGSLLTSWSWSFGDGSAGSDQVLQNPSHTYSSPGTYTVYLTTSNDGGSSTASAQTITVGAPVFTGITPASGPTSGGTSVTITGTGFTGATAVTFGGTAATSYTVNSATSITVTTPAHAAGAVNVVVSTPGGLVTGTGAYTYASVPTVTGISPAAGPVAGGTSITITGTGFTGATSVTFGGTPATTFTVNSAISITATSPGGSAGTVDIIVTTPGGISSNTAADNFRYAAVPTFSSLTPTAGPVAGGTSITITGTGFTGATSVTFGGTTGTGLTVNSATSITVTTPAHTASVVNVVVTTPGGIATGTNVYTFAAVPIVTSVSPSSGTRNGGTTVTITGTGFTGATAVKFGTTSATTFTVNSANSITVTSPAHSAGTNFDITVTTPGGTSATSSNDHYTYT